METSFVLRFYDPGLLYVYRTVIKIKNLIFIWNTAHEVFNKHRCGICLRASGFRAAGARACE
jgi:hypothetical protein